MPTETVVKEIEIGYNMPMTIAGIEITSVGDVTGSHSFTEIEVKRKGDRKVRYVAGMEHKEIDFDIDSYDKDAIATLNACLGGDMCVEIEIGNAVDKFIVTKMDKNEPVDDIVTYSVSIRLALDGLEEYKTPSTP